MLNSARRAFVPLQIRKTLLMHPSVRALSTVTDQMRNSRYIRYG